MSDNYQVKDGSGVLRTFESLEDTGNGFQTARHYRRDLLVALSATPTVSTSPAYATGDALGSAVLSFAGAAKYSGGYLEIVSLVIIDKAKQTPALDLILFDTAPAAPTDNAAFSPTDTEMGKCLGVISIVAGDYSSLDVNAVGQKLVTVPLKLAAASTTLYGVLVARSTPTFAGTSDVICNLIVRQQ